jgi:hypothetical protein
MPLGDFVDFLADVLRHIPLPDVAPSDAPFDRARALEQLPKEIRRKNQDAAARRVALLAGVLLGGMVVAGILVAVAARRLTSFGMVMLLLGSMLGLVVLLPLTTVLRVAVNLAGESLGWPGGAVLLDLGISDRAVAAGNLTARSGAFTIFLALVLLYYGAWPVGLLVGFFGVAMLLLAYGAVGRIELTEGGLRYAPRFWRWKRFVRHVWTDDRRWVALRQKGGPLRTPWILVPVPEGLSNLVDGDLNSRMTAD